LIYVKKEETKDKYTYLTQLINRKIRLTSIKGESEPERKVEKKY